MYCHNIGVVILSVCGGIMRFVIAESFDKSEINHFFEAEVSCRIGGVIKSKSGKIYRVEDIAWHNNTYDHTPNVRVLLKRER